jgi:membrane fusion protein, multidrug efflux system
MLIKRLVISMDESKAEASLISSRDPHGPDARSKTLVMDQNTRPIDGSAGPGFHAAAALNGEDAEPGSGRLWLWLMVFGVLCIVAYAIFLHGRGNKPVMKAPTVPVSASIIKSGTLNIYSNQIGTVTPFNTVTVKSRIAGQIIKIDFKEGQLVNAGDPLVNIDPSPYQAQLVQYDGQLARDQATLANAKVTLERYRVLYQRGVIAIQDLNNQEALYQQAIGTVENDRGMIAGVKVNLGYCRIVSPIRGRVGLRQVDLGNYVQATDSVVVITQLQPISVIFSIPEDQIPEVVGDMRDGHQVPVVAWNRDFTKKIANGFLLTFDNEVDQNTGTVKLRAQFANQDYALFPDQFVNASMLVKTVQDALLAPTPAIQTGSQGSFVYVVQPNNTVVQREVTVGQSQGDVTEIIKGISAGDKVVTDGLDKLQPGTKVVVRMDSNSGAPASRAAAKTIDGSAQTGG